VPAALELETVGDGLAFVSAVAVREEGFRPTWLPRIGIRFDHLNFRTYVRRGDHFGVFFFHTAMSSPFAPLMRSVSGMPTRWTPLHFERARDRAGLISRQAVYSADYAIAVEAQAFSYLPENLTYFPSLQAGLEFLTGPRFGYFVRGGEVYEYEVAHKPLSVREGRIEVARLEPFEELGILISEYESEHPHSVFLAQPIEFTMYFPAKRVGP
jgi:uncharacterized protein YqjF (DUF2071 family)